MALGNYTPILKNAVTHATASSCSALLISWGYEQNGIAGEKFAERLNKMILKKL